MRVDNSRLVPALHRRNHAHALFVLLVGVQLDAGGDTEHGGFFAVNRRNTEVPLAARDNQTDIAVGKPVLLASRHDDRAKLRFRHGDFERDSLCRRENAVYVLAQPETPAAVGANPLEHAVAVQHAVVEHRNAGLVAFHKLSVKINVLHS